MGYFGELIEEFAVIKKQWEYSLPCFWYLFDPLWAAVAQAEEWKNVDGFCEIIELTCEVWTVLEWGVGHYGYKAKKWAST